QIPKYRYNIEVKVRSLKEVTLGGKVLQRIASMLPDIGKELQQAETQVSTSPDRGSATGTSSVEPAKHVSVEIRQLELQSLLIAQSLIGPWLQPLAMAGLVIVFVIMILLERGDLRDRLLRLAGRRDLHRTTVAMDDAGQRVSRYLLRQLL